MNTKELDDGVCQDSCRILLVCQCIIYLNFLFPYDSTVYYRALLDGLLIIEQSETLFYYEKGKRATCISNDTQEKAFQAYFIS